MIEVVDEGVINESRVTARNRTAQAIHYYNNNVLKARTGSKSLALAYSSGGGAGGYHRQQQRIRGGANSNPRLENLYRSNSSLELLHDTNWNECHRSSGKLGEYAIAPTLKREYGSHGSIDVISINDQKRDERDVSGEQFLPMLQDYKPAVSARLFSFFRRSSSYFLCSLFISFSFVFRHYYGNNFRVICRLRVPCVPSSTQGN